MKAIRCVGRFVVGCVSALILIAVLSALTWVLATAIDRVCDRVVPDSEAASGAW